MDLFNSHLITIFAISGGEHLTPPRLEHPQGDPIDAGLVPAHEFLERGMDKSGIRLLGTGDLTDDDELPGMSDAELGIITAHHYSALHESPANKTFVRRRLVKG